MTTSARAPINQQLDEPNPGLNPQFIDEMIHRMSIKRYNPGEVIVQKGDVGREMFYISKGLVHVHIKDKTTGKDVVIPLTAGKHFGEVTMYLDTARTATITAATESDVLVLRRDVLLRVLQRWPAIMREFQAEAARRQTDERAGTTGTSETTGADWMHEIAKRAVGYDPSVQVVIRVRPRLEKEMNMDRCVIIEDASHITTIDPTVPKKEVASTATPFKFDYVFDETSTTEEIFDVVGNHVVDAAYDGFNTCVFAYGQTGTGKSYTMLTLNKLVAKEMFARIAREEALDPAVKYTVKLGYVEVYMEKLTDLLIPSAVKNKQPPPPELKIREKMGSVFVENLQRPSVKSVEDVEYLLKQGEASRTMETTAENTMSSPGHAIVIITLRKVIMLEDGSTCTTDCRMNLVDLAGTARVDEDKEEKTHRERRRSSLTRNLDAIRHENPSAARNRSKEASKINLSLETLSDVITKLAFGTGGHIPYRNSTLTRLLSQCFGGNCKTYMIANIGPCNLLMANRTLRKAESAMNIINKPVRAHPKGVIAGHDLPEAETVFLNAPATEFPTDKLINMIEEANQLCEKTGNQLTFSLRPHEQFERSRFAVYVTDHASVKSELLSPDDFALRLDAEREWVKNNFDEKVMDLTESADRLSEPFWMRPPDRMIGTVAIPLKDLLDLKEVSGEFTMESADGSCEITAAVTPRLPEGSNVTKMESLIGTSFPCAVSIPGLKHLETQYNCGVYVRYLMPYEDDDKLAKTTIRTPNDPAKEASFNHQCLFDFPVDQDIVDSFSNPNNPQELILEVWGHDDESYYYPDRLRALLDKADAEIARLTEELVKLMEANKMANLEKSMALSKIKALTDAKQAELNQLKEKAKNTIQKERQASEAAQAAAAAAQQAAKEAEEAAAAALAVGQNQTEKANQSHTALMMARATIAQMRAERDAALEDLVRKDSELKSTINELVVAMESQKQACEKEKEAALEAAKSDFDKVLAARDAEIHRLHELVDSTTSVAKNLKKELIEADNEKDVLKRKMEALLLERRQKDGAFEELCRMYRMLQTLSKVRNETIAGGGGGGGGGGAPSTGAPSGEAAAHS